MVISVDADQNDDDNTETEQETQPGDWLSWLRFSWFSSEPLCNCHYSTLNKTTTASVHILSNSLFINHPIRVADSIFK
jgi:hypothetical protein